MSSFKALFKRTLLYSLSLTLCVSCWAYANGPIFGAPQVRAVAIKVLVGKLMNQPRVRQNFQRMSDLARCSHSSNETVRTRCKEQLDFLRVGLPDGFTAAFTYTPVAPLTVGVSFGGTGATISANAEATLNVFWKDNFTPVITIELSNIYFTSFSDGYVTKAARPYLYNPTGGAIKVSLAGSWMHTISAMAGVDWVTNSGWHIFGKAGVFGELNSTKGHAQKGRFKLHGWWGPAAEVGVGGNFSWF